ncbi:POZ domain-containing protein [Punctularia strigosozonata HHB-11173 SS5]|uniref:Elongin-C n=1 Tax=Punctularia strigosozonata (strain HHB-11173) TaxID=741275 RepID=R7S4I5_PUNST|nr:POZ domain-containing protein [Punctularia strigosozonata HHB-11173 SS5]EIN04739.1 POZ domain-containing protein [Punctularia strigosozonata HHB-11173 SS5]
MAETEDNGTSDDDGWVLLTSNDGHAFMIKRDAALGSGFSEAKTNTCHIDERAVVVEKLCEYLSFKYAYDGSKEDMPDFSKERIPPEITLELLMAADYYEMELTLSLV